MADRTARTMLPQPLRASAVDRSPTLLRLLSTSALVNPCFCPLPLLRHTPNALSLLRSLLREPLLSLLVAMSRRVAIATSNGSTTDQHTIPPVYRDGNGTVHLASHRKHRPPTTATTTTTASTPLKPPTVPSASTWRHDRPPRRQPNYELGTLFTSTPVPVPLVAVMFLTLTMQCAMMLIVASPLPFHAHLPLVYITAVQMLLYFVLASISRLSPLACLLLSPSILVCPHLYPPTSPFFTYMATISALTYWPHLLDLYVYRKQFAGWSVWMRIIFVLSYIDLRDGAPITDTNPPPYSPSTVSSHPSTTTNGQAVSPTRAASWSTLKPYFMRDARESAIKDVQVAICCALLYFLPYATFFPTVQLLVAQPFSSVALSSLAVLYARYLSLLLLLTSSLSLIDNFYSLLFLCLSLQCFPSQHSPLSCHSLSSFWGGRWNRTIHQLLYHTFYLPLHRVTGMTGAGVVGAFVASALLHAYPGWVAGMGLGEVGSVMGFFLAHSVFMLVERLWIRWRAGGGGGRGGTGAGVGGGGESKGRDVLLGRVWFWSCFLVTLPLICEPFFSLFGGGKVTATV